MVKIGLDTHFIWLGWTSTWAVGGWKLYRGKTLCFRCFNVLQSKFKRCKASKQSHSLRSPLSSDPYIKTDHELIHVGRILQFTSHSWLQTTPCHQSLLHWFGGLFKGLHAHIHHMCLCLLVLPLFQHFSTCSLDDFCAHRGFFAMLCASWLCLMLMCCSKSKCIANFYFWYVTWVIPTELVPFRWIPHLRKMLTRYCLCVLYMLCHDGLMQLLDGKPSLCQLHWHWGKCMFEPAEEMHT